MNQKPTVHRWTSKTEYYNIEDGTQISKQLAERDFNVIKTTKITKIENHEGRITWLKQCERKRQLSIW